MIDTTSLRRGLVLTAVLAAWAAPTASGRVADPPVRAVVSVPSASEHARDQRPTPAAITFTNPLHRSRGPGAGAGLL